MRTVTTPPRRRTARGPACDDRPRLWGDEPAAPAEPPAEPLPAASAPTVEAVAAPEETYVAAGPSLAPAVAPAAPIGTAVAAPDETYVASPSATLAPPAQTLEDLIAGTWDGLVAGEATACPVCSASMTPRWSAGAGVVGGRCGGCGTNLE